MEYILSSNYAGSGARVAISRFAADGTKASEVHAIISLPDQDSGEQPEAQIGRIARAADSLITELEPAGLRPVMARWLLSDAANLAPLLPGLTCGPVATSVIGQAPLNYTHCALWLYFMATDKVERIDDYSVAASRRGRSHIFTGSASISGLDSHKATTAHCMPRVPHPNTVSAQMKTVTSGASK